MRPPGRDRLGVVDVGHDRDADLREKLEEGWGAAIHDVLGERVKTSLEWDGSPPLRYSVGDIYQVFTEQLPGLAPGPRVKVLGRVDDLLIIKGRQAVPRSGQGRRQRLHARHHR